jgi:hypothetical protein
MLVANFFLLVGCAQLFILHINIFTYALSHPGNMLNRAFLNNDVIVSILVYDSIASMIVIAYYILIVEY